MRTRRELFSVATGAGVAIALPASAKTAPKILRILPTTFVHNYAHMLRMALMEKRIYTHPEVIIFPSGAKIGHVVPSGHLLQQRSTTTLPGERLQSDDIMLLAQKILVDVRKPSMIQFATFAIPTRFAEAETIQDQGVWMRLLRQTKVRYPCTRVDVIYCLRDDIRAYTVVPGKATIEADNA